MSDLGSEFHRSFSEDSRKIRMIEAPLLHRIGCRFRADYLSQMHGKRESDLRFVLQDSLCQGAVRPRSEGPCRSLRTGAACHSTLAQAGRRQCYLYFYCMIGPEPPSGTIRPIVQRDREVSCVDPCARAVGARWMACCVVWQ